MRYLLAAVIALALLPAAAQAHVTVQPNTAAAGSFTVENVRVPNETDNAVTTKVDVQMPPGFVEASYQSTPGWSVKVTKRKLATPVKTDDGEVTEEVARITWTASDEAHGIQPGQFRDFPLSVAIPGKNGDKLTFKALQTYSNGDVVRWIGAEGSDTPAPVVDVADPAKPAATATPAASAKPVTQTIVKKQSGGKGLAIVALVLAAVALALGAKGAFRSGSGSV